MWQIVLAGVITIITFPVLISIVVITIMFIKTIIKDRK